MIKGTCRNTSLKLYLNEINAEAQRCSSESFKMVRHKDATKSSLSFAGMPFFVAEDEIVQIHND